DQRVDALGVELRPSAVWDVAASVVDEDVEPAVLPADRLGHLRHPCWLGEIGCRDVRLASTGGVDAFGDGLERSLAPASQDDAGAFPCQRHRASFADAAARPRHPGDLAIEIAHAKPPALGCGRGILRGYCGNSIVVAFPGSRSRSRDPRLKAAKERSRSPRPCVKCAQLSPCTGTITASGNACAVSMVSLAFMVRLKGPRVCAAPAKTSTTPAANRRATSATPSHQTVSPVT